jgi:FtsP/CotA-like multicopper oxidase with cupredoxin domain
MNFIFLLLLSCIIVAPSSAIKHDVTLVFTKQMRALDGYPRPAVLCNDTLPGPTLKFNVGDTALIKVVNIISHDESINVHFHGLDVSIWYDGSAFIANCPIPFGSSFVYNLTFNEAGTFMYHGHTGTSRVDGSYGILTVSDPNPKFKYDDEIIVTLADLYHESKDNITVGLQANPFVWPGNGESILVNGKGLAKGCYSTKNDTITTVQYPGGDSVTEVLVCQGQLETINVIAGKTYLLHISNMALLSFYNFAIAGHNLTVIGIDGSAVNVMSNNYHIRV